VRRFVQEDPIGYGGGSNVYAYGAGGPLEKRDPSGLRVVNVLEEIFGPLAALPFSGGGGDDGHWLTVCDAGGCSSTYIRAPLDIVRGIAQGIADAYAVAARAARSTMSCLGNAGCDVDPAYLAAVYRAVTQEVSNQDAASARGEGELRIYISGVFLTESGAFASPVRRTGVPVLERVFATERGEGLWLRERTLVWSFELYTDSWPFSYADQAEYYGTIWIQSYPPMPVWGTVYRGTNTGVFSYSPSTPR